MDSKLVFKADSAQATASIKGLKGTLGTLKGAANGIGAAFKSALLPLTALAAVAGGAVFGVKDIIDFSGHLQDLSGVTGIAVKDLVILEEQFRAAGAPVEKLDALMVKLSNTLDSPSTSTNEWLEKFKLNAQDIAGLGLAERFQLIGSKIGGLASETEKANAATDFFGKQGKDLINMFNDPNGFENAKKYVGGLADTMDRTASRLESAGDSIDGIKVKLRQFFASFTEKNLMLIEKVAEVISNLDLSKLGGMAGSVTGGLYNAFQDGKLGSALYNGMLGGLQRLGEYLISICEMAGNIFAKAIKSSFEKSNFGQMLIKKGMLEPTQPRLIYDKKENEIKENPKYVPDETWDSILARNMGSLGSEKSFAAYDRATQGNSSEEDARRAADAKAKQEAQATASREKAREATYQAKIKAIGEVFENDPTGIPIIGSLIDFVKFAQDPKASYEKLPKNFDPSKPGIVSSLARIGGAKGETGGLNPLIKIQRESLKALNSIDSKMSKNRTSAAFG